MGFLIPAQLRMTVHLFRLVNLIFFASRKDQRNKKELRWKLAIKQGSTGEVIGMNQPLLQVLLSQQLEVL